MKPNQWTELIDPNEPFDEASDLHISLLLFENDRHGIRWTCHLSNRHNGHFASKGIGETAPEALSKALDRILNPPPFLEIKVTGHIPDLSSILPKLTPRTIPGIARR